MVNYQSVYVVLSKESNDYGFFTDYSVREKLDTKGKSSSAVQSMYKPNRRVPQLFTNLAEACKVIRELGTMAGSHLIPVKLKGKRLKIVMDEIRNYVDMLNDTRYYVTSTVQWTKGHRNVNDIMF